MTDLITWAAGNALDQQHSILFKYNDVAGLQFSEYSGAVDEAFLRKCRLHGRRRHVTDQEDKLKNHI